MSRSDRSQLLNVSREADFPRWYLEVIKQADLAENSVVRGCMVIKPWGQALWEELQRDLDRRLKEAGHQNAYFPLLIPLSLIEREAEHVEGFAKEMAVVTHHRLRGGADGLKPDGELAEPLVIRPTSETIIGESLHSWVQSYRDLPMLINQWANVMRWELRPRLFLRTAEFLWQEGHTVHATADEAERTTRTMLDVYRSLATEMMAMPVIAGEKTPEERFPGAERTLSIEALMQDGKALQAGTSHYLGQNFARSSDIRFTDRDGSRNYAYTTSCGVSTRLIGGLVMTHADDIGMRVPPALSPHQVVVIPMAPDHAEVGEAADGLSRRLRAQSWRGSPIRVHVDRREYTPAAKRWTWTRRGVPLIVELGPRDLEAHTGMVSRRWLSPQPDRRLGDQTELIGSIAGELEAAQASLYAEAQSNLTANIRDDLRTSAAIIDAFSAGWRGGVLAGWNGKSPLPGGLSDLGVSRRCITFARDTRPTICAFTGETAASEVLLARAY